jgi:hypothetical protein
MKKPTLFAAALAAIILTHFSEAQVPQLINYTGRVAVGTVNFDGSGQFKFALVDGTATTTFWSNDGTSVAGSEPTAAVTLAVAKGLYSVLLGNATLPNMTAVPATVFANPDVRLRVWFNDGVNGFQLMTPDQRIAAVGYAMMATTAQTVPDGAITSAKIATGAVGTTQLAVGSVGSAQIATGAIGSTQLAAGAVGSTQLAAGTVGFAQLAKPPQSGAYTVDPFATSTVTVTFPQAYAVPPVVTVSPGGSTTITNSSVMLISTTATGFSAMVSGQPTIRTVDSGSGEFLSLAAVNGNPAMGYYDRTNGDLKYTRALDASGTSWGTPMTVANTGNVGESPWLAVVNGNPAMGYWDRGNGDLKYVRALDASGTNWGTPVTLDSNGSVGLDASLVVVNGNPAISYHDSTNGDLKYVRALDPSGTNWGTPVTVDSNGFVGACTSLVVVNGNPAISYLDSSNGDLKYVRAQDASGTSWGTPMTVDSPGVVGSKTSLAVVNGNPAISYLDNRPILKYVRANDSNGSSWGNGRNVLEDNVNSRLSLGVINGIPVIACRDQNSQSPIFISLAGNFPLNWIALPQ